MFTDNSKPYTFDRVFRIIVFAAFITCGIWLIGYLSDVLFPFVVAFLAAYLLNPVVSFVQKRITNRAVSIIIVLVTLLLLFLLFLYIIIPMINGELAQFGGLLAKFVENKDLINKAAQYLPPDIIESVLDKVSREKVIELMKQEKFWTIIQSVSKKLLPGLWGIISGTATFIMAIVGLFITGLYLFFMLFDYERVKSEWEGMLPESLRLPVLEFLRLFDQSMSRYFRAQALIAMSVGIIFSVGFGLIKLPMGIVLGLFIGLLNMVPYLQIIGIIPAVMMALMKALETGASVWPIIGLVLLIFTVAQLVQDIFLTPRIMGKITGLSPAMTLLSISIWGKLLGFLGLIIAIPMTCLVIAYYQRFLKTPQQQ